MNKKTLFLIGLIILAVLSAVVVAKTVYPTFTTLKASTQGTGHFGESDALPMPEIRAGFTENALTVGQKATINFEFDNSFEPKTSEIFFKKVSYKKCGDADDLIPPGFYGTGVCSSAHERSVPIDKSFDYESKFTISEINFMHDLSGQTIKNTKGVKHARVPTPDFFDSDIKLGTEKGKFTGWRIIDNNKLKLDEFEFEIECESPGESLYGFIAKIKRIDTIENCKKVDSYRTGTTTCSHQRPGGVGRVDETIVTSISYKDVPEFDEESIVELKTIFDVPIPCTEINGPTIGPNTGGDSGGEETPIPPTDDNIR